MLPAAPRRWEPNSACRCHHPSKQGADRAREVVCLSDSTNSALNSNHHRFDKYPVQDPVHYSGCHPGLDIQDELLNQSSSPKKRSWRWTPDQLTIADRLEQAHESAAFGTHPQPNKSTQPMKASNHPCSDPTSPPKIKIDVPRSRQLIAQPLVVAQTFVDGKHCQRSKHNHQSA